MSAYEKLGSRIAQDWFSDLKRGAFIKRDPPPLAAVSEGKNFNSRPFPPLEKRYSRFALMLFEIPLPLTPSPEGEGAVLCPDLLQDRSGEGGIYNSMSEANTFPPRADPEGILKSVSISARK